MSTRELLQNANRAILDGIAEQDRALAVRETALTQELEAVVNQRKRLKDDRDILVRAEEIQLRILEASSPEPTTSEPEGSNKVGGVQTRARIGPQRYAMLTALRDRGHLTVQEIADITGLPISRVREQMRDDTPVHVEPVEEESGGTVQLALTQGGYDLLSRFEAYRKSEGKPLPSLVGSDEADGTSGAAESGPDVSAAGADLSDLLGVDEDLEYEAEPAQRNDGSSSS